MRKYYPNIPSFGGIFAFPCEVVDRFLNEASPDDLKVLLYSLRHNIYEITDDMSEYLGLTKEKIARSFEYWESRGLLLGAAAEAAAATAAPAKDAEKKVLQPSVTYSSDEITNLAQQNPDLKFLLNAASEKLKRLLSAADCSALVYLYQFAGLPADVILMLIEYCVSIGKGNIRYIQKTGLGWADDGIDTHERAEEKIHRMEDARSFAGSVKSATGISGRGLTRGELEHIARWQNEFKSPLELITMAYEICIERLGKLSFAYMNSILRAWHENGLTTAKQVEAFKKNKKSGKAPSYDIDEYVRLSMQRLTESPESKTHGKA